LGPGQQIAADALPFKYPDGSHNCETLLVHPVTGVLTVVTKVGAGASTVYEFPMPLVPGQTTTLIKKGRRSAPQGNVQFTGADGHRGAKGVLLRTYTNLFYFPMGPSQSVADALLGDPCPAPSVAEGQGEAVGFYASGAGYVTLSEGKNVPV